MIARVLAFVVFVAILAWQFVAVRFATKLADAGIADGWVRR